MATDYIEKERVFIASLEADTGSDLAGWMRAIDAAKLTGRNAIIDWLRHQGFTFSNASWLERIHHNSGKLIYGGGGQVKLEFTTAAINGQDVIVQDVVGQDVVGQDVVQSQRNFKLTAVPASELPSVSMMLPTAPPSSGVAALLANAKGLRPLAEVVMGHVHRAVPGTSSEAGAGFIIFKSERAFAALLPGPKELRLYGDFGESNGLAARAGAAQGVNPAFPQMLILNDARQITPALADIIRTAHARASL